MKSRKLATISNWFSLLHSVSGNFIVGVIYFIACMLRVDGVMETILIFYHGKE